MSGSKSKTIGGTTQAYGSGSGSRQTKAGTLAVSGASASGSKDEANSYPQGDNLAASGYGEQAFSGKNEGSSSYGGNAIDTGRRLHVEKYWLPPSTTPPFCLPGGLPARGYQNPNQLTIVIDKSTINYPTPPQPIPVTTQKADIPSPCPNFPIYLNSMLINTNETENSGGSSGSVRPHFNNCAFYDFCCDGPGTRKASKTSSSALSTKTRSRKSSKPSSTVASTPQDEGDAFDVGAKSSSADKKKERASKNLIFRDDEPSDHSSSQIESFKSLYYY